MGEVFPSSLEMARLPKTSQQASTSGNRRDLCLLQNPHRQPEGTATTELGAIRGRAALVRLGRFGYCEWVRGSSYGIGTWDDRPADSNSTVLFGLTVAANVVTG